MFAFSFREERIHFTGIDVHDCRSRMSAILAEGRTELAIDHDVYLNVYRFSNLLRFRNENVKMIFQ